MGVAGWTVDSRSSVSPEPISLIFYVELWTSVPHGVHTWNSGHGTIPVFLAALVRCLC